MGKLLDHLDDQISEFVVAQQLFFVATAPSGGEGHVNLSPKGLDTFRVMDPHTVAYLDLTGSGVETIAHLRDNGRITLMFCSFGDRPLIVRLYGRGEVIDVAHASFADCVRLFPPRPGIRSVIRISLERVSTSCGYAVPVYEFRSERPMLDQWAERKGPDGIATCQEQTNRQSIDGLPGL